MNNLKKNFDALSYFLLSRALMIIMVLSMLTWCLPLLYAICCVFRREYSNSINGLLLTTLLIIIWRGGQEMCDRHNIRWDL
jgi:hypothetical protein